jgi:hypothetical protein
MTRTFQIVRAVRGPLVLITLGILFLIDQSGGVSFGRTWPILFIAYGALKLAERLVAPPLPVGPPPPPPPQYYPPTPQGGPSA